jgi:hypothetical protein
LANQLPRRVIVTDGKIGAAVRRNYLDAQLAKLGQKDLGHHQVASQAVGSLHEHESDAVGPDTRHEIAQAVAVIEILRAADPFVAVLVDDLDAAGLRIAPDGFPLPRESVAADLSLARYP